MKFRKLIAAASAAIMSVAALSATAGAYEAFLMYADGSWSYQSMDNTTCPNGNTDVTGDGTYTVYVDSTAKGAQMEDEDTGEMVPVTANGATVFCVDIADVGAEHGFGKGNEAYDNLPSDATGADKMQVAKDAGIEISNVTIQLTNKDGSTTDVPVDMSKIIFGDIEGNGKLRIEIYNAYGAGTQNDPPIDTSLISFDEKMAVTFTISGLDAAAPAADDGAAPATDTVTAPAATADKGSPNTGVEGVAAIAGIAVLAAGAVFVARKKK